MKGRAIIYSDAEMAWLEANCTLVISEYHRGFCEAFDRDVSAVNLHALRKRKGWKTGRTGCFEKGSVPHNKGVPCAEGRGGRHPNARKTQFQKGHGRSGVAVQLYKPIGTERYDKNGYLQRKVNDGFPLQRRWRFVHVINWEAVNGPVPKGYALKCLDGNKLNTDPTNWEAVPRALLPRLAGGTRKQHVAYDDAPAELKPAILSVAKLEYELRRRGQSSEAA